MKKILKILFITLGVILILLITLPILFKSKIEEMVKEKVNEEIHATVNWSRFGVNLFRGFPDLSVNLFEVSVVGKEPFEGDTLAGLNRFEFRVNPFSALRKDIEVKSILLDRPLINGIILEDGTANWELSGEKSTLPKPESSEPDRIDDSEGEASGVPGDEKEKKTISVSLQRFAISKGRIFYRDEAMGLNAALEEVDLELKGNFSMEQTDLNLQVKLQGIQAKLNGIRYMRDGTLALDLIAAADLVNSRYTLQKNEIRLNGLVLGAEGTITLMEDGGMDMDLQFYSRETSFQTLLSLVPAIYLKDFETLTTRGNLQLEGAVSGVMKDSILPDVTLDLQVTDGYFAYPDLPKDVSDVQLALHVDYKGADMDATTVNLDRFHLLLGGNPFDLKLQVEHPVSDMHVTGEAVGMIDFASLQDVVPLEDVTLDGRLETDLRWDTRMSSIEQEQFDQVDLSGSLLIADVRVEAPDVPVPVDLQRMEMEFNPRFVELVTLDLAMGASDLQMNGELTNFIPYLFDDQTVSGSLNVSSQLLDVNELVSADTASDDLDSQQVLETGAEIDTSYVEPAPADSLAKPTQVKIPENINFRMNLDLDKVIYDRIVVENIKGAMEIREGVAHLDQLNMDVIEGKISTSGVVDTRGEFAEVDVILDMQEVDIPSAYETFVTVERLVPMARYCKGTANVTMQYESMLDASFSPLYESINANGRVFTKGLQIYNLKTFVQLSELLKNEKFREMAPDEVNVGVTVRDGRVMVAPFDIDFDASKITVSGSHGIDLTMDYLLDMDIAKSDLGEGANELMNGITALATTAGFQIPQSDFVNVKAKIQGTFNDPKVTTDLSGNLKSSGETVREVVEERVVEEVEEVEEQVREEVSEKAEEIIRRAEAEGERLIREARRAGEALVKEAEAQGEKLVEEAGSNPIRQIAAKRAAEELKNQAEKQSDNLIREAEAKSDELVEKARAEAERI